MITTFFLVVTVVFIIIGMVYFGAIASSQEGAAFKGVEVYEKANDIKQGILQCYGRLSLDKVKDKNLAAACTARFMEGKNPPVRGFSIEALGLLSCEPGKVTLGDMNGCSQRFVYHTNVDENYSGCLGRIMVCS